MSQPNGQFPSASACGVDRLQVVECEAIVDQDAVQRIANWFRNRRDKSGELATGVNDTPDAANGSSVRD